MLEDRLNFADGGPFQAVENQRTVFRIFTTSPMNVKKTPIASSLNVKKPRARAKRALMI